MNFIYVLPIGDITKEMLGFAQKTIEKRFDYICNVLDYEKVPEQAFAPERCQYLSTEILKRVLELCPENADKVIGITPVDIFIPILTFVFGQAQLDGKAAVVSTHRLRQECYGLPRNDTILYERLAKEIVHELGHTFGMVHCRNIDCAMHFSNSIRDIDVKKDKFCESCLKLLGLSQELSNRQRSNP